MVLLLFNGGILMEQTSLKQMLEGYDKEIFDPKYPYKERAESCKRLTQAFYAECGVQPEEPISMLTFDDCDAIYAGREAKKVKGVFVWLGEEWERVYRDGKFVGKMLISCRGSSFGAEKYVRNKKAYSDDTLRGVWQNAA